MNPLAVTILGASLITGVPLASAAGSADKAEAGTAAREKSTLEQQELYRGSRIIGAAVHDARDRKIGEVKDLLLDSARGEVAYAILGFTGRKLHAVPWRALHPSETDRVYILDADREVIAQAPGFDMGDWPDTGNQRWSEEIDRYWNRMVGREPTVAQPATSDPAEAGGANNASGASGGSAAGSGNSGNSGNAAKPGSAKTGRADKR